MYYGMVEQDSRLWARMAHPPGSLREGGPACRRRIACSPGAVITSYSIHYTKLYDSQEKEIVKLKKTIDNCCVSNNNSKLKSATISDETTSINESLTENAKLFDNIPNPFSLNTEIKFEIPENYISARLIIHDLQGIEIKSYAISQGGFGSITINGSDLKAGMYLYTLLIDNKIIDTKRMILTKE